MQRTGLGDITSAQAFLGNAAGSSPGHRSKAEQLSSFCRWRVLPSICKNATSMKCRNAEHDNVKCACTPYVMSGSAPV